ncbi:MAG: hypothetical protein R6U31_00630 [bacterium]
MKRLFILAFIILTALSIPASEVIFDSDGIYSLITSPYTNAVYISPIISSQTAADNIIDNNSTLIVPVSSFQKSYSRHCSIIEAGCSVYALDDSLPFSVIISPGQVLLGSFELSDRKYLGNCFLFHSDESDVINSFLVIADSLKSRAMPVKDLGSVAREDVHSAPGQFVNKMITLRGTIDNIREISGSQMFLLNMQDPVNPVTIVIFNDIAENIIASGINPQYFLNREISVKGVFIDHPRYGYEIILNSPDNIAIID